MSLLTTDTGVPTIPSHSVHRVRSGSRVLTDTVHERIREAILSAELRPNSRLVENVLAIRFEVSRTPVREALVRLEQEGFVERGRGWVVRERKPTEIRARLECRLAIEGFAARLAAERRDSVRLQVLSGLEAAMTVKDLPRSDFNALNDRFHRAIIEAADNPTLASLHTQTRMNYWDLNVPVLFSDEDDRMVFKHHRDLLRAIESRDGDSAERIAREHVQLTIRIVIAELEKRFRSLPA